MNIQIRKYYEKLNYTPLENFIQRFGKISIYRSDGRYILSNRNEELKYSSFPSLLQLREEVSKKEEVEIFREKTWLEIIPIEGGIQLLLSELVSEKMQEKYDIRSGSIKEGILSLIEFMII